MIDFKQRGVVITGAASGIGEALAQALAAQGARLLLADVDAPRLEAVAKTLQAKGASCEWQIADVASRAALQALADRAQALWGGADVLINNAGVGLVAPVASLIEADARWLMDINFWGVANGCQVFLPQLKARPQALIVNVSSVFAMISMPTQSIYNAAKAAVRAYSDALREELSDTPVRLLCVHPGGIQTRIVEQARLGDISAVADSPEALRSQFAQQARTTPAQAAAVIINAMQRGDRRVLIGIDARLGDALFRLVPSRASAWFTALARWQRKRLAASGPRTG